MVMMNYCHTDPEARVMVILCAQSSLRTMIYDPEIGMSLNSMNLCIAFAASLYRFSKSSTLLYKSRIETYSFILIPKTATIKDLYD